MARPGPSARPLIEARNMTYHLPCGRPVFSGLSLSLGRARTGLLGENGAGKSTLVRILAAALRPSAGTIHRAASIGYLPQDAAAALSLGTSVGTCFGRAPGEPLEPADLAALSQLRLTWIDPATPLAHLSGGERTRIALAALLAQDPEMLILDEPTNHLDAGAREVLYSLISNWRGGMLVVTHDRRILAIMDEILELDAGSIRRYGGGYELYEAQRHAEAAAATRAVDHAESTLRRARRDAQAARERQARRDARGRASRDSSGIPKILLNSMKNSAQRTGARLRTVHAGRVDSAAAELADAKARAGRQRECDFTLTATEVSAGKDVLRIEDLWFAHAARPRRELFHGLTFRLTGPQRLAITGPNGSGKSTLLHLIAGTLSPDLGRIHRGVPRAALLDQHARTLEDDASILDNFRRLNPEVREADARLALARFMFRADEALRPAGSLSGGQRLRAALACALAGPHPASLLLLDEPANHLDLPSIRQLESALRGYRGAMIIVSHDRPFLDAVGASAVLHLGGDRPRSP